MSRNYPRFLFSNPINTKSKGPFVFHSIFPAAICKIIDYDQNNKTFGLEVLKMYDDCSQTEIDLMLSDMRNWILTQAISKQIII